MSEFDDEAQRIASWAESGVMRRPERTLAAAMGDSEVYRHLVATIGDVGDATRTQDDIRVALKRFEPELWAAFMHRAIEGGRNCGGAERAVCAMLYGWGVTKDEADDERMERMRKALETIEESKALTEDQLFEASARMVGRYLRKHPEGWPVLNKYLPVEASEAER